jgi:hypothetical protein
VNEHVATYLRSLDASIDELREQLRARHGWTHVELELDIEPLEPALRVRGTIAVPRLRAAILAVLEPQLLPGLALKLELDALPVREWYAVPDAGLELWAQHPSKSSRALATELGPDDGPVGALAHDGPGMLLRARDGTVGWATGLLGPRRDPRPLVEPRALAPEARGPAVCAVARRYLGTPYLLGGASEGRIDCSALVQRAYLDGLDVLLPRNSHDQLALTGGRVCGTADGARGDLIFIRSRRMQRLHVGVVGERGTIIHASRTRAATIEQPQVDFQLDAEWLRRVELDELLDWARTQVGRAHVELPTRQPRA